MTKMIVALMLTTLAALTGCGTMTSARPMSSPMPPPPVAAPMPVGPAVGGMPGAPVPPPRPETMMGPPQNWGWIHTPPMGCDRGPNSLAIANDTDYYMRIIIDGEDLLARGAYGTFPELPPRTVAYVCLAHTGVHSIAGVAYTLRYGVPQEVEGDNGRFRVQKSFGVGTLSSGRHELHINTALLMLE